MEYLDIVDEEGNPTGETVEREYAHANGIRHRTSHVWLVREKENRLEVLLQKRSDNKDSYPGCYDISSAGHIPAGVDWKPSAIRELKEELGVEAKEEDLIYIGTSYSDSHNIFHGKPFNNVQVSHVYMLYHDSTSYTLQVEEVSAVEWMEIHECMDAVMNKTIPNCIKIKELEMILNHVEK